MFFRFLFFLFSLGVFSSNSFGTFVYDVDKIESEKSKYNFQSSDQFGTEKQDRSSFKGVKIGGFSWFDENDLKENYLGLSTRKIMDCVAVIFMDAKRIGLGHIDLSEKTYEILKKECEGIKNQNISFKTYVVSSYFSKNLDGVISILKENSLSIEDGHIGDAFAECNEYYNVMGPVRFFYKKENNMQTMQIQNFTSKEVFVKFKDQKIFINENAFDFS